MEFTGTQSFDVTPEALWQALHDPQAMESAIPACRQVTGIAETGMSADLAHKFGPMDLSMRVGLSYTELTPREALRIDIKGKSLLARGARARLDLTLSPGPVQGTVDIAYRATAELTASLTRIVGDRVEGAGNRAIVNFLKRLATAATLYA